MKKSAKNKSKATTSIFLDGDASEVAAAIQREPGATPNDLRPPTTTARLPAPPLDVADDHDPWDWERAALQADLDAITGRRRLDHTPPPAAPAA